MNMRKLLAFFFACATTVVVMAQNINFTNAEVKRLCVANWDTDKDGQLSRQEAAAVISLGTVFRENGNIGEFPELKYFTGITAIDDSAFYKSSISGEVRIPGNVKTIGDYAFNSCRNMTRVVLEEGVQTVGWHSFSGPIRTMVLPTTLTYMSSMAVDPYVNSDPSSGVFVPDGDLYLYSRSKTPAAINGFAFYFMFSQAHLIVPPGYIDDYKAVEGWSHFGEYLQFGDVNMDGNVNGRDVVALRNSVMGRKPSPFNEYCADVNIDNSVNGRDVIALRNLILGN